MYAQGMLPTWLAAVALSNEHVPIHQGYTETKPANQQIVVKLRNSVIHGFFLCSLRFSRGEKRHGKQTDLSAMKLR